MMQLQPLSLRPPSMALPWNPDENQHGTGFVADDSWVQGAV